MQNDDEVEVVEASGQTLVELSSVSNSQSSLVSDRPASSVDGASLWWRSVKLELSISHNRSDSSLGVGQDGAVQSHGESVFVPTRNAVNWVFRIVLGSGLSRVGGGARSLHLAVTDLGGCRNCVLRGGSLDLAIANLSNNGSRRGGGVGLDLTVADLCDNTSGRSGGWSGSGGLDLAVTDLSHDSSSGSCAGGGLDLSVSNLRDNSGGRGR
ncbi:hypothetical protein OGATHE_002442 [Ogataea polymorpha]|uniref:Uncharacterized protein n=1 Tax=Ogataea polymorpha TaxID=460523 RepID=A0A9P8PDD6_9ASCO|nr:hypothetical protein OGATHE_002442 [Ogataea polymorpha]